MQGTHRIRAQASAIGLALLAACTLAGIALEHARAETTVTIAYFDGATWYYGIYDQNGLYAESVPESQLAYAPTPAS